MSVGTILCSTRHYATPADHPKLRRVVISCDHATTYAHQITPYGSPSTDRVLVALGIGRHEREACGCAHDLETLDRTRRGVSA